MDTDLQNLSKVIFDVQIQKMEEKASHSLEGILTKIILLGSSGTGKSTISLTLSGKGVRVEYNKDELIELVGDGVNFGGVSCTDIPTSIIDDENHLAYIDTPGFGDSRGPLVDIKHTFSIQDVFKLNNNEIKFKFIFVIDASEMKRRAIEIQALFNRINSMFPNLTDSDKKAFGIIFNRGMPNCNKTYIKTIRSKSGDSSSTKIWCEYFLNHLDQTFIIPEASDDMVGQIFTFEGQEELIQFFKKDYMINPVPQLAFSPTEIDFLQKGFLLHSKRLKEVVSQTVQFFTKLYTKITDFKQIRQWENDHFKNFPKDGYKDPSILMDVIKANFPKYFQEEKNNTQNTQNDENFEKEKKEIRLNISHLDFLNVLNLFFIQTLNLNELEINQNIEKPIDDAINKMFTDFSLYIKSLEQQMQKKISTHIQEFLKETQNSLDIIANLYNKIKDLNELNNWSSQHLEESSNVKDRFDNIKYFAKDGFDNPRALIDSIQKNFTIEVQNGLFKSVINNLDKLNSNHSSLIEILDDKETTINARIKNPIKDKINAWLDVFNLFREKKQQKYRADEAAFSSYTANFLGEAQNAFNIMIGFVKNYKSDQLDQLDKWYNDHLKDFPKNGFDTPQVLINAINSHFANEQSNFKNVISSLSKLNEQFSSFKESYENKGLIQSKITTPIKGKIDKMYSEFDAFKTLLKKDKLKKEFTSNSSDLLKEIQIAFDNIKDSFKNLKTTDELTGWDDDRIKKLPDGGDLNSLINVIENQFSSEVGSSVINSLRSLKAKHSSFNFRELNITDEAIKVQIKNPLHDKVINLKAEFDHTKQIIKEKERTVFKTNNARDKHILNSVQKKLDKGGLFSTDSSEREGIFSFLTSNFKDGNVSDVLIDSNSIGVGSRPINAVLPDESFTSSNKEGSYISFNFMARKAKIEHYYIQNQQNEKYGLIKYRLEASNDNVHWVCLDYANQPDGTKPQEYITLWSEIDYPSVSPEDEYKLYYKYFRFTQTGHSYNSNSYVFQIKRIELYGVISEPQELSHNI